MIMHDFNRKIRFSRNLLIIKKEDWNDIIVRFKYDIDTIRNI